MIYSQGRLIELLKKGLVPGESSAPEHIETVISNVFLFPNQVYKVYKNKNSFFNKNFHDISTKKERFAFSISDFEWNHQLTKEVYLHLQGVKVEKDTICFTSSHEDAEELLLVTKRLPHTASLFNLLQKGTLIESDYYEIGKQFAEREKGFVWQGMMSKQSVLENMLERYVDVIEWVKSVAEKMPPTEWETYVNQLKELIMRVYEHGSVKVSICFDLHSLNAFYMEQKLYPFDTHPPKDLWHFGPALLSVYRLATDVLVFAGEKEFRAVMQGYRDFLRLDPPPKETERLLIVYSSLIMVSYLYMLGKTDIDKQEAAVKYHDFLKRYTSRTFDV